MTESPWEQSRNGLSVTIKSGTGYDAYWIVVHASNASGAQQILAEAFELDESQPLHVLAAQAETTAGASRAVAKGLGGTRVPSKAARAPEAPKNAATDTPKAAPEAEAEDVWVTKIHAATTKEDLRKIWGEIASAGFTEDHKTALQTEMKNKAKELA